MSMYPVLVCCISASEEWKNHSLKYVSPAKATHNPHNYPDDIPNPDFIRVMLTSYTRTTCWLALKEAGIAPEIDCPPSHLRWRAVVPTNPYDGGKYNSVGMHDIDNARLELYLDNDDQTQPFKLVASYPVCGNEFDALPLVARIGIELLWRKECRGKDSE